MKDNWIENRTLHQVELIKQASLAFIETTRRRLTHTVSSITKRKRLERSSYEQYFLLCIHHRHRIVLPTSPHHNIPVFLAKSELFRVKT